MRQYIKAHDGLLLANHGALTVAHELFAAYYKMETIEHFAKISLVARMLGGERLLSQDEVMRLQGLRGHVWHRGARAHLPRRPAPAAGRRACQVVRAPDVPGRAARERGARRDG